MIDWEGVRHTIVLMAIMIVATVAMGLALKWALLFLGIIVERSPC